MSHVATAACERLIGLVAALSCISYLCVGSGIPNSRTIEKLPPSVGFWNFTTAKYETYIAGRLGDDTDIRAALSVASFDQMRPFIEKLEAGKPVTVLAFGDSITQVFGGCFHRDDAHMADTVHTFSGSYDICQAFNHPWGFLNIFMQAINNTWPHPDHVLVNLGIPACSFQIFAFHVCVEPTLPKSADLVFLEHLTHLEGGSVPTSLAVLFQRLRKKFNTHHDPPAVLLNMHRLFDLPFHQSPGDPRYKCIMSHGAYCNQTSQLDNLPEPGSETSITESQTNMFAARHHMASISYSKLLQSIVNRGTNKTRVLWPTCQVLSLLYSDSIHPGHHGQLLLGDVLISYLADAQAHIKAHPNEDMAKAAPRTSASHDASAAFSMQCFGVSRRHHLDASALRRPPEEMHVVKAEGWSIVEIENGKFKPGWVSIQPGSLLWILLDVGPVLMDRGVTLEVSCLRSYEHMGMALISCVDGCECIDISPKPPSLGGVVADFHFPADHWSGSRLVLLKVVHLKDQKCTVQVQVLNTTNSGEHKVKITEVAVKSFVDASKQKSSGSL